MKTCPDCNGDGVVDKDTDDERQCPTCGGLGFVPDDDDDHEEVIKTSRDLPTAWEANHERHSVRIAIDPPNLSTNRPMKNSRLLWRKAN
jgi:hypothetical protein